MKKKAVNYTEVKLVAGKPGLRVVPHVADSKPPGEKPCPGCNRIRPGGMFVAHGETFKECVLCRNEASAWRKRRMGI